MVAGGDLHYGARLEARLQGLDYVIAADSGVRHCLALGLDIDLLVGDMDSISPVDYGRVAHVPSERHPEDKDALDLELALEKTLDKRPKELLILAATGSRLDQSLAAVFIASKYKTAKRSVVLLSGTNEVHILADESRSFRFERATCLSLLSLSPSTLVSLRGTVYELAEQRLNFGSGLGISNESRKTKVQIEVEGMLLCVLEFHVPPRQLKGTTDPSIVNKG